MKYASITSLIAKHVLLLKKLKNMHFIYAIWALHILLSLVIALTISIVNLLVWCGENVLCCLKRIPDEGMGTFKNRSCNKFKIIRAVYLHIITHVLPPARTLYWSTYNVTYSIKLPTCFGSVCLAWGWCDVIPKHVASFIECVTLYFNIAYEFVIIHVS
jgi:hypothetical protein